ncbi:MAG TPA: wax ester/triacylglycerol synthase domain-containing protein, partial [Acidimicrobiales bacterium]|nr:wax ester/triacylglycerol synthase domain-containing protein [Acidimicrobiales bacterium]
MKRMSGLDASFLYMEAPTMHMHIVGVVLLESVNENRVVGFDDVLRALDERLHLIPPLRRRMVAPLAGVDHPIWIEDPDFDLRNHVRPFPGQTPVSWQSLEKFVGEVSSRQLDRARPLWEMWIVEGVEGRSTAIVTKLH